MAGQTTTTYTNLLKDRYESILAEQINRKCKLRRLFENRGRKDSVDGAKIVAGIVTNGSWAAGSPGDSSLPTESYVESEAWNISYKRLVGKIRLERFVIEQSRTNAGAFANAMKLEIAQMMKSIKVIHNRQLHGDGTGKLAEVASLSGQNITMNATYAHGGGINSYCGAGARHIRVGMVLAVMQGTGTTLRQESLTVTAVNYTTHVVTVTGTCTGIADGDSVYQQIKTLKYAQNNEWMGIGGCVDDSTFLDTFQNLARSSYPITKSSVVSNSGSLTALTTTMFDEALHLADLASGDADIKYWWSRHEVATVAASLLRANKRYEKSSSMGQGFKQDLSESGFKSDLTFGMDNDGNPIPLIVDRDASYYWIYGLDPSTFKIWELTPLKWAEIQGKTWHLVDGNDDMQAWAVCFGNMGCLHPHKNVVIRDINMTPQTGYTPS